MQDKTLKLIKAAIISMIAALLITGLLFLSIKLFFGQEIDEIFSLINKISIPEKENEEEIAVFNEESKMLNNYPEYGTKYGTITIEKIDKIVDLYYGDTLDILKKGAGHSSGSYFPGEGGSIVCMGHNSKNMFRRFSELELGDKIVVTTTYGEYTYKIYDMQIVKETETEKLPIQKEKEILMIYTCYPFNNIGYATQRYVVYAEPENK